MTAGKFNSTFVVAGSTLEDFYTQGLEGDVIARSGNTLTLRGSTLQLNDGVSQYNNADAVVIVGPSTIVTAEDNTTLTGLNYNSIVRRAAHHRPRHLRAAGVRRRHPGCHRQFQHQHGLGAPGSRPSCGGRWFPRPRRVWC